MPKTGVDDPSHVVTGRELPSVVEAHSPSYHLRISQPCFLRGLPAPWRVPPDVPRPPHCFPNEIFMKSFCLLTEKPLQLPYLPEGPGSEQVLTIPTHPVLSKPWSPCMASSHPSLWPSRKGTHSFQWPHFTPTRHDPQPTEVPPAVWWPEALTGTSVTWHPSIHLCIYSPVHLFVWYQLRAYYVPFLYMEIGFHNAKGNGLALGSGPDTCDILHARYAGHPPGPRKAHGESQSLSAACQWPAQVSPQDSEME